MARANKKNKRIKKRRHKSRSSLRTSTKKYILNSDFEFFRELEALVLKPSPGEKSALTERIQKLGKVRLAVISGLFLNQPIDDDISDLFIVGDDIDRSKLSKFLKSVEAQLGQEIKFALMDKDEYKYRMGMFDRFVRILFDGPHEKLIDKISNIT